MGWIILGYSFLIVLFFTFIFLFIGRTLLQGIGLMQKNVYADMAMDFFVGMAVYLAILRTISYLLPSYRVSFWLITIIFVIFLIAYIYKQRKLPLRGGVKCCFVITVLWIFVVLYRLLINFCDVRQVDNLTAFSSVGTLHSIRYANIARYFVEYDRIPILNQSYGQSILGSLSIFFGTDNTNFALVLWLAVSAAFMLFYVYGIFRRYFSRLLSILLTATIAIGGSSLSLFHILLVDSGYPLMMSGYTDSVVGVITFVIYLTYLIHVLVDQSQFKIYDFIFNVAVMVYWAMSAPQNIVITCGVGVCFICRLVMHKEYGNFRKALFVAILVFMGCFIGILEGGMMTPTFLTEQVEIAGLLNFAGNGNGSPTIKLSPIMPYVIEYMGENMFSFSISYGHDILQYAKDGLYNGEIGFAIHHISMLIWDSIRIIFWPFVGMIGIIILYQYRIHQEKKGNLYSSNNKIIYYWGVAGVVSSFIGYLITFFFNINGYKWQLTRFMFPMYFLGMFFLAWIMGITWNKGKTWRIIDVMSMCMIMIGPIINVTNMIVTNLKNSDVLSIMKLMIIMTDEYVRNIP